MDAFIQSARARNIHVESTLHHPVPAQDNHVRKHDENWTTKEGVTKGGKDINTFRGKYGEDKGG